MDVITDKKYIQNLLKSQLPLLEVVIDEPMKAHTSFRIGGNADVFILPSSEEEIVTVLSVIRQNHIPLTVIGNGSNLLVSDEGIEGAVLCIGKNFSNVIAEGDRIFAASGTLLTRVANTALEHSLTGMEFASGIPGSLGGAVMMNAGAYGGEMKDIIEKTRYINANGEICECDIDMHGFAYRRSNFTVDDVILSSVIKLQKGDADKIKNEMYSLSEKRRDKQPLEYPSAGSTFKRPEGHFAAKLIDDAGLRGYRVGDAMVSCKHCGFVVNVGNATFADVRAVMNHVTDTVKSKFGVELEPEVRILGR